MQIYTHEILLRCHWKFRLMFSYLFTRFKFNFWLLHNFGKVNMHHLLHLLLSNLIVVLLLTILNEKTLLWCNIPRDLWWTPISILNGFQNGFILVLLNFLTRFSRYTLTFCAFFLASFFNIYYYLIQITY